MTHKFSTEMAIKVIVGDVRVLQDGGAGLEEQLSFVKQHLFDESFMDKKDRNNALKEINQFLGTNWSMTQIRKSPTKSFTKTTTNNLVEVDELNGSIVIQTAPESEVAQEVVAEQTKTNSDEEIAMNTVNTAAAAVAPAPVPTVEAVEIPLQSLAVAQARMFFEYLGTDLETGFQKLNAFMEANPEVNKGFTELTSKNSDLSREQNFCIWMDTDKEGSRLFSIEVAQSTLGHSKEVNFSGQSEGIQSKWVGAVGAVVGGALEMFARGEVNIPKVAGTIAGAAGAYFAGDLIDDNIDSQYGRYAVAGAVGLALGGAGSAVGGMAGNAFGRGKDVAPQPAPTTPAKMETIGMVPGL